MENFYQIVNGVFTVAMVATICGVIGLLISSFMRLKASSNLDFMEPHNFDKPVAIYRQGDVMLYKISNTTRVSESDKYKEIKGDRIVLAYGETTGHAHAIYPEINERGERALPAKLWDAGAERFILQVTSKTSLKHEEHSEIPLDEGIYRVVRQREYDPEAARNAELMAKSMADERMRIEARARAMDRATRWVHD